MSIRGAGGKGGKGSLPRTPTEASDTLVSTSTARVLDLICEGEIEGLVDGLRSVYLDGTPIENSDGSQNFTGVELASVNGTQAQSYLEGFSGVESETGVGVEILAATPVTQTVTNGEADAVRVRIAVSALSVTNALTGDTTGTTVSLGIDVQSNGGGFVSQALGTQYFIVTNPMAPSPTATGIKIEVQWVGAGVYSFTTPKFSVEYRVVGAGGWTVAQTDSFTSAQVFSNRGPRRSGSFVMAKSYIVNGLAQASYEARVVETTAFGGLSVKLLWGLFPSYAGIITGKASNTYLRSYRVELTGLPPWDIRVSRSTPDSTSSTLRNKTFFESITEIIDEKFSYPNSALMALSVDAKQFQTIPQRGYDCKLLRVKIPSNYDPITRSYTGTWDGTFIVAWTDNPAWCFYDLLTNTRYGLGNFLAAAQVDKFGLYVIGQYCDGLVNDGQNNFEPRFTCNLYLQQQEDAFKVIADMASIFRGMAYWAAGAITAAQDAPTDPVFLFTEANVADGTFSYSGSSKASRHTAALVTWNDPEDGYKAVPEYVEDVDGISRYGLNVATVTAVGCVSRGQARRVGEWMLYSERYETEVVKFTCGQDGVYLRPGNIFSVQDQHRAGLRYGGRVVSSTVSSVIIDAPITISGGVVYTIQVVLPDGSLITKTLTNGAGSFSVLTISVNFVTQPLVNAGWIVTSTSLSPRLFRAIVITEIQQHQYEVTGLEHNASKFAYIERDIPLLLPNYSTLKTVPAIPTNIVVSQFLSTQQNMAVVVVTIRWDAVQTATRYRVQYRRGGGNFVELTQVAATSVEITNALPGIYEVRVASVGSSLLSSAFSPVTIKYVFINVDPPVVPSQLGAFRAGLTVEMAWGASSNPDLDYYEIRGGWQESTWSTSIILARTRNLQAVINRFNSFLYHIRSRNTSGNYSVEVQSKVVGVISAPRQVVAVVNDAFPWSGSHDGTQVDDAGFVSIQNSAPPGGYYGTWSSMTGFWTTYTGVWRRGFVSSITTGIYTLARLIHGFARPYRLGLTIRALSLPTAPTWSEYVSPWLNYQAYWTSDAQHELLRFEVRWSQDLIDWTPWVSFSEQTATFLAAEARVIFNREDIRYVGQLTNITLFADARSVTDLYPQEVVSVTGLALTWPESYFSITAVQVSLVNGAISDTFTLAYDTASLTVHVYTGGGVEKAGVIDITVVGFR